MCFSGIFILILKQIIKAVILRTCGHIRMTEWEAVIEAYVKSSTISTSRDDNVHQLSIIADAASKGAVTLADIIEFMGDENHRFLNSTIERYITISYYN